MVERDSLDSIFAALSDHTRRDILRRVAQAELSISDIAAPYQLTFAAISKHLVLLEKAGLITKHRQGKQIMVQLAPGALQDAASYLQYYTLWGHRLEALNELIREDLK